MTPALLLLLGWAAAQEPAFDESFVRLFYRPDRLWRNASGDFLGTKEDGRLVLIFDFLNETQDGRRITPCPSNRGVPERAATCEEVQDAVGEAFALWNEAAGRLQVRRRASPSEPVNIWIGWTRAIEDPAKTYDTPEPPRLEKTYQGFARPAYPRARKQSSMILFKDVYCWYLEADDCPEVPLLPSGKLVNLNRSVRIIALHEGGHALGFGHMLYPPSIMDLPGEDVTYLLTPFDRQAVRILYDRVWRSLEP